MRKKLLTAGVLGLLAVNMTGCIDQADFVSYNIQREADNFNVVRRLTVLNARSDKPMMVMIGKMSYTINDGKQRLEVLVETGKGEYKKHFIGLNDWVLYTIEDLSGSDVDKYKYTIKFFPESIIDVNLEIGDD